MTGGLFGWGTPSDSARPWAQTAPWIAASALVIGFVLLVTGFRLADVHSRLQDPLLPTASAVVTGAQMRGQRPGVAVRAEIDGRPQDPVDRCVQHRRHLLPGDRVEIVYDPADPQRYVGEIGAQPGYPWPYLLIGFTLIGIGLAAAVVFVQSLRAAARRASG